MADNFYLCGTMRAYEGPELPKSEIAVLDGIHFHGGAIGLFGGGFPIIIPMPVYKHRTYIIKVDEFDRELNRWVHILPGQHTATVHYWRTPDVSLFGFSNYETRDLSIDFVAEAGHEYRIPAERRGERNWIWVEDLTSGKLVAGEKPVEEKGEERDAKQL